jgi:hypothetical protein
MEAENQTALRDFFDDLERRAACTRERVEMLRDGRLGLHSLTERGYVDITHEAIAREEAMLAADEELLACRSAEVAN